MFENRKSPNFATYKLEFMNECANNVCDAAAQTLLSSLSGNPGLFGCDMMEILYKGDVNAGYHIGYRDNVEAKAAYLLNLVNVGISAHSIFLTI